MNWKLRCHGQHFSTYFHDQLPKTHNLQILPHTPKHVSFLQQIKRGGRRFKLDVKNFSEARLPFISNSWLLMGLKRRQVTSLRDLGNFVDILSFLSNISMFDCFIEFTSNKSGVQGLRHFVRQQAISVASQVAEKLKVWDSNPKPNTQYTSQSKGKHLKM